MNTQYPLGVFTHEFQFSNGSTLSYVALLLLLALFRCLTGAKQDVYEGGAYDDLMGASFSTRGQSVGEEASTWKWESPVVEGGKKSSSGVTLSLSGGSSGKTGSKSSSRAKADRGRYGW